VAWEERQPPDGKGTVFVNHYRNGTWRAIWQGDGEYANHHISIEGGRQEVLRWVAATRAATYQEFDNEADAYLPMVMPPLHHG
jgi:hypothetical protein